jgi:hypothetical protein
MTKTGSTNITPRLGATVLYTLNQADVDAIMTRRQNLGTVLAGIIARRNDVRDGDTYPAIIVKDHASTHEENKDLASRHVERWYPTDPSKLAEGTKPATRQERDEAYRRTLVNLDQIAAEATCNLQVLLDGTEAYWATSRSQFDPEKHTSRRGVAVEDGKVVEDNGEPDPRGHWQYRAVDRRVRFATGGTMTSDAYPVVGSPAQPGGVPGQILSKAIAAHEERQLRQDGLR